MRVLSLDTTGRGGSVALVVDGVVVEERPGDPTRSHAERLPGDLTALVDRHGMSLASIDVFAVAVGPGSFTGLRIGIATIQGLAFVSGRPVVGVSALDALAHLAAADLSAARLVAAWIDAQRGDVFSALFRIAATVPFVPERLVIEDGPKVASPAATLAGWRTPVDESIVFAGDGATRYASEIEADRRMSRIVAPPLLAGAIGLIAAVRAARGDTVSPAGIRPLYVRRPDAELARDMTLAAKTTSD